MFNLLSLLPPSQRPTAYSRMANHKEDELGDSGFVHKPKNSLELEAEAETTAQVAATSGRSTFAGAAKCAHELLFQLTLLAKLTHMVARVADG